MNDKKPYFGLYFNIPVNSQIPYLEIFYLTSYQRITKTEY